MKQVINNKRANEFTNNKLTGSVFGNLICGIHKKLSSSFRLSGWRLDLIYALLLIIYTRIGGLFVMLVVIKVSFRNT